MVMPPLLSSHHAGTGKSETGAHIAYIFAQVLKEQSSNQCLVYCAPSNKAVDVVHGKFKLATNNKACMQNPKAV